MTRPKRLDEMTEHELQQLAQQQLADLKRTLDMLDRVRAQRQPAARRKQFRVIAGGAS